MERSVCVEVNADLILRRPIDTSNTGVKIFLSYKGKNISWRCSRIRVGCWGRWLDVKGASSWRMGKEIYRVIQNDCRGTIVQRQFRTKFGKQPSSDKSIRRWYAQFQETGCVCIPELKVWIRTAIETITADMLQTVWNELDYRVDVCRITKGAHIEHL